MRIITGKAETKRIASNLPLEQSGGLYFIRRLYEVLQSRDHGNATPDCKC